MTATSSAIPARRREEAIICAHLADRSSKVFSAAVSPRDLEAGGPGAFFEFASRRTRAAVWRRLSPPARVRSARPAWASDPLVARLLFPCARRAMPMRAQILAAPVDGGLFFAGEACSTRSFSTAHGAYLTGRRRRRAVHRDARQSKSKPARLDRARCPVSLSHLRRARHPNPDFPVCRRPIRSESRPPSRTIDAAQWDACANPTRDATRPRCACRHCPKPSGTKARRRASANRDGERFNPFVTHAFLKALESSKSVSPRTGWTQRPCPRQGRQGTSRGSRADLFENPFDGRICLRLWLGRRLPARGA